MAFPALLAISFMHCKNVRRETVNPPKPPKFSISKIPKHKFIRLHIDPMKEVLRKEGGSEKTGLKKALHICRGHFTTYGENSKGMFGKGIKGTFWIPQHTRGSLEHGSVDKEYVVGEPS